VGVEIIDGIVLNDRVVTGPFRGLDQLKEGSKVKIEDKKKEGEEVQGTETSTEDEDQSDEQHAFAEND
jgi:hypothetical protein